MGIIWDCLSRWKVHGAGKTTVINQLIPLLQKHALVDIVSTREPGGSRIAEDIRNEVILDVNNTEMDEKFYMQRRDRIYQT